MTVPTGQSPNPGQGQAVPGYPSAAYSDSTDPGTGSDIIAGALMVFAAIAAAVGLFGYQTKETIQSGRSTFTVTYSDWTFSPPNGPSRIAVSGAAVTVALVMTLVGGIILLSGRGRRVGSVRIAAAVTSALLFATASDIVLRCIDEKRLDDAIATRISLGLGFWTAVVTSLTALAAVIITIFAARSSRAAGYPGQFPAAMPAAYAYGQPDFAQPPMQTTPHGRPGAGETVTTDGLYGNQTPPNPQS